MRARVADATNALEASHRELQQIEQDLVGIGRPDGEWLRPVVVLEGT